jgi:hypothetical protein
MSAVLSRTHAGGRVFQFSKEHGCLPCGSRGLAMAPCMSKGLIEFKKRGIISIRRRSWCSRRKLRLQGLIQSKSAQSTARIILIPMSPGRTLSNRVATRLVCLDPQHECYDKLTQNWVSNDLIHSYRKSASIYEGVSKSFRTESITK